jgi:hypothetical protein
VIGEDFDRAARATGEDALLEGEDRSRIGAPFQSGLRRGDAKADTPEGSIPPLQLYELTSMMYALLQSVGMSVETFSGGERAAFEKDRVARLVRAELTEIEARLATLFLAALKTHRPDCAP